MAGKSAEVKSLPAKEAQRRLSREQLLKPRIRQEEVPIDSLGGTVVIRSMSHELRQSIRDLTAFGTEDFDEDKFTMLSIVHSIVDPKLTEEDVDELKKQNTQIIDELIMQITIINLVGQAGDLKKESSETQN